MRLIVAGTRTLDVNDGVLNGIMDHFRLEPTLIVSGGCRGVDGCGKHWAKVRGIPVRVFEADWDAMGKAAGPVRNRAMAAFATALLLVWDGKSPGSRSMRKAMMDLKKPVYEVVLRRAD